MSENTTIDALFPEITEYNEFYYKSLKDGILVANQCKDCNHVFLPPAKNCRHCLSENINWTELSGEGTVYSYVEYLRAFHEAFKDKIPYVVAIVELKEGPRIVSNIIDYDIEKLKIGTSLEVVFNKGIKDFPIVQFRQK